MPEAPDSAVSTLAKVISGECPGVLAGVPNEELNPGSFTPRVRGERQREEMRVETIPQEFAQAISAAVYKPDSAAIRSLRRTDHAPQAEPPADCRAVHFDASSIQEDRVSVPQVVPSTRAWSQTGYHTLSPASRAFKAAQKARVTAPRPTGSIKALLQPYEDAAQRTLVLRRTEALRSRPRKRSRRSTASTRTSSAPSASRRANPKSLNTRRRWPRTHGGRWNLRCTARIAKDSP